MSEENQSPISEENQSPTSEENNTSVSDKELNDSSSSKSLEAIRARSLPSSRVKENPISSKEKQKFTHNEAINEYYRLKDKYESVYYEKYVKPIVKSNKSKREKRVEYSRLPKNECINCKRNVGTIFNITLDKEIIRKFTAKCGDLSDPCPLDIQITSSYNEQIDMVINAGLKIIEELKLQIIKEKNNVMFFYNKVSTNFDKLIEKLKTETENTGFVIENNILKNNNPEKEILLKKTIDEFSKELLLQFKQMINEYIETNDELKLNEAVKFYVNEIIPKLKEIQSLKYNVNYVEYEANYDTLRSIKDVYKLIQLPNSLENTEFSLESDNKVLKFVTGVKKNKKAKTMKLGEPSLKKTRKISPSDKFIIEDEEIEIVDGEKEIPELMSKKNSDGFEEGIPDFDAPEGVKWDNEKYNEIWRRLPTNVKDVLLTDEDWTQEYVSKCVASKNKKEPCRLFLPKKTIIPPNKIDEGSFELGIKHIRYDFGVEALNKMFDKNYKSYKDRILTWSDEKYAANNYAGLRDILLSLLERELNIDNQTYGYGYN